MISNRSCKRLNLESVSKETEVTRQQELPKREVKELITKLPNTMSIVKNMSSKQIKLMRSPFKQYSKEKLKERPEIK